ncbi:MAG: hypothetical protein RLZZ352_2598 [Pseudomonadota bacterium]|jgi:hypothetical protein
MPTVRHLYLPAALVRRCLRWLLLCVAFAALHNTLGAWVVQAWSGQTAVEICTPQGMQWVALDEHAPLDPTDPAAQGLAQPCVWASAHLTLLAQAPALHHGAPLPVDRLRMGRQPLDPPSDRAERVLLMAPMRAPPVCF